MSRHSRRAQRVATTVAIAALVGCSSPDARLARVYTDPQYAFRLVAPDTGWVITDATGIRDVLVVLKSESRAEGFVPNVTVSVEPLPRMMTADEYGERSVEGVSDQGCELLSVQPSVINGTRYCELQCLMRATSPPLRLRYVCLVRDRIGYVITCTSPETCYGSIEDDFESIVQSFRFL